MMKRHALGATCVSCFVAVAGLTALGLGGYMTLTGKSLCSLASTGGEKAKSSECTDAKAVKTVAAKEGEKKACCPLAKLAKVNAKGSCGGAEAVAFKPGYVVLGASHPVVMPAAFHKADAKFCPASLKEVGCGGAAKSACTAEAKAGCASAKSVAAKSGCSAHEGKAVAAKAEDPGCCKGTGVRADGQPCKGDCGMCKKDKPAEGEATQEGKPIASR